MNRLENAKKYLSKIFISEDFKDLKKESEILEDFSLSVPHRSKKTSFELRPCYEAPLLSFSQEQQLFRQMNYFKYQAKTLLDDSIKNLEKVESLIKKAKNIRNRIAESNFRLATQLLKQNIGFYRKHSLIDSLLSDAYCDVIKSVDYFDWTRGHKFSTYATWVIKKNFFRDFKDKQKYAEKIIRLQESEIGVTAEAKNDGYQEEVNYECQKKLIQSLLTILRHGDCTKDQSRQVFILENYFGLNGKDKHTLEEISQELSITKERVRQLKEKALKWLKTKVKEMNLNYESSIESFR